MYDKSIFASDKKRKNKLYGQAQENPDISTPELSVFFKT